MSHTQLLSERGQTPPEGSRGQGHAGREPLPGRIGPFPVRSLLGEGGMGRVFRCWDASLGREVAVKLLRPGLARVPEMARRFEREAKSMAMLSSPWVVTVFAVGEQDGSPYVAMELLEGEDLSVRVARGPLSLAAALRSTLHASRGLAAAHEAGLVHRDVKPANLVAVGSRVKLTDFGLARPLDGTGNLTQAGIVLGSPNYVAPEVARGEPATAASDLYSLGCTLFELLTGRVPFPRDGVEDVIAAHLCEPPPRLRELLPSAPSSLDSAVQRLLRKDPEGRLGCATELCGLLEALLAELGDDGEEEAPAVAPAPADEPPVVERSVDFAPPTPPGGAVRTKTLAVMFTDIAGYAERTGSLSREEAAHWLELHDALLLPVIEGFGGDVIKTIGDAFLVTFGSPTDAVLCGTAIQDRLWLHNAAAAAGDRLEVRVAISVGEVRLHKGDVLGEPVNLAARLEDLAEAGEVLVSDAVFSTMNVAEVSLSSRGTYRLKGIRRDVTVYTAAPDSDPGRPPFGGGALESLELDDEAGWLAPLRTGGAPHRRRLVAAVSRARARARRLARVAGPAAAMCLALLVGGAAVFLSPASPRPSRERVDGGEAKQVLAELDEKPQRQRSAHEELLRGHALAVLGRRSDALWAYATAASAGVTDGRALSVALTALSDREHAAAAARALTRWPSAEIDDRLAVLLNSREYELRRRARAVLLARERTDLIDEEALATRDVSEGPTCPARRDALRRLADVAHTQGALLVVERAAQRMPANACLEEDLDEAKARLKARLRS